ncbi:MAG TPA: DUF2867 domain-containing protein [Blastocatellia bacterium]|nr:DUF2867 domain-containing protein [Blastocatellia bacterium]
MKSNTFNQLPIRAHSLLASIPLRTLERVELPGGRDGMSLQQISNVVGFGGEVEMEVGYVTRALFWLRGLIGRIMHWDGAPRLIEAVTFLPKLTAEDRARSSVTPGQPAGISRILYQFENEMLGEIVNRTVHCFWLLATERIADGYVLWLAVYVRRLNWFTPIYMALITPVLKWIIYPAMIKGVRRRWLQTFPASGESLRNSQLVWYK